MIRIKGASEHHVFNRRGKIGGIIWGGVEHVTFRTRAELSMRSTPLLSLEVTAAPAVSGHDSSSAMVRSRHRWTSRARRWTST